MHFKGVVLELLTPICKREKSSIPSCGFFSIRGIPPCSRWDYRQTFLPWLGLVCPLLTQVSYSSLLVLPLRWGGDAPGVDLMASQIDLVPYHQDLCLICLFPLMPPGVEHSNFPGMFPKLGLLGEASLLHVPVYFPEYSPKSESENCSVMPDPLQPYGLYSPWNSLGQNTGVDNLSLLQGIFPTQESHPGLPHYRWIFFFLPAEPSGKPKPQ